MIAKLKTDETLQKSKDALEALEDLEMLFKYCSIFKIDTKVNYNFNKQKLLYFY